ncbi:MAG: ATP-dependent sacrificial sulfur transferase LarE [Eubacteriales bacterium]|nr:ATP-dependent sacrificial sulfur transferase LarE [Eubacteriales bacterium]
MKTDKIYPDSIEFSGKGLSPLRPELSGPELVKPQPLKPTPNESDSQNLTNKKNKLAALLAGYAQTDMCVAFSGGVDSSLLLVMACQAAEETGKRVCALTMDTVLHPKADLAIARTVLAKTKAEHYVLTMDELAVPEIRTNPVNRCYLCKKELYSRMLAFAGVKGAAVLLEGSNEDDLHVYRPGLQAVKELGVKSPLAECGITKEEVRTLAREYDIPVADRPSAPCLATRLPYGAEIDLDLLSRIEAGEEFLKSLGLGNVRIRVHGDILRIEADIQQIPLLMEKREQVIGHMKLVGCPYITIDMEGFRSGSMDIHVLPDDPEHRI